MQAQLDWRKLSAEAVGTFALIFIAAGSIIMSGGDIVAVAFAYGLVTVTMVSAMHHVSGALFNPALTLGLWATRRMGHVDTASYIVVQVAGAAVAGFALLALFPEVRVDAVVLGTPALGAGTTVLQAIVIEAILTAFLMAAVFGTVIDSRGPNIGGLGIGLVLTMGIFAGGPLTGAAMNPARAFGPALAQGFWTDHAVYWIGPIIGAVLAALFYHFVLMNDAERTSASASAA